MKGIRACLSTAAQLVFDRAERSGASALGRDDAPARDHSAKNGAALSRSKFASDFCADAAINGPVAIKHRAVPVAIGAGLGNEARVAPSAANPSSGMAIESRWDWVTPYPCHGDLNALIIARAKVASPTPLCEVRAKRPRTHGGCSGCIDASVPASEPSTGFGAPRLARFAGEERPYVRS